jgi:hypothetical protein
LSSRPCGNNARPYNAHAGLVALPSIVSEPDRKAKSTQPGLVRHLDAQPATEISLLLKRSTLSDLSIAFLPKTGPRYWASKQPSPLVVVVVVVAAAKVTAVGLVTVTVCVGKLFSSAPHIPHRCGQTTCTNRRTKMFESLHISPFNLAWQLASVTGSLQQSTTASTLEQPADGTLLCRTSLRVGRALRCLTVVGSCGATANVHTTKSTAVQMHIPRMFQCGHGFVQVIFQSMGNRHRQ